jgi:xylulokinase
VDPDRLVGHRPAPGGAPADIDAWNPAVEIVAPDPSARAGYDELYRLYLDLYPATRTIAHSLANRQRRTP